MSPVIEQPNRSRDITYIELSPVITTSLILFFLGANLLLTLVLPSKISPEVQTLYLNVTIMEIVSYSLMAATVEEFVYRFVLIAFVSEMLRTHVSDDKSLKWLETAIKGQSTTMFRISRVQFVLITLSSMIFAGTHIQTYGIWKTVPAFLVGMALGLVYCWHGFIVAVALHSSYNIAIIVGSLITRSWSAAQGDLLVISSAMLVSMIVLLVAFLLKWNNR